jgi:hypothetical protein
MTKTLSHKTLIRLPAWDAMSAAEVNTLNGYCPDFAPVARGRGEPEVWASYAGSALSNDRSYYDRQRERVALAVTVEDGERVTVDGADYVVKVMRGNHAHPANSDPIHFAPAA